MLCVFRRQANALVHSSPCRQWGVGGGTGAKTETEVIHYLTPHVSAQECAKSACVCKLLLMQVSWDVLLGCCRLAGTDARDGH